MPTQLIRKFCELSAIASACSNAPWRNKDSAPAHDRILKVARTVADLDGIPQLEPNTSPRRFSIERWTGRIGCDVP